MMGDDQDLAVGDRVMTVDGYPGVIREVVDGLFGAERYAIILDNGMGGGDYGPSDIVAKIGSRAAKTAEAQRDTSTRENLQLDVVERDGSWAWILSSWNDEWSYGSDLDDGTGFATADEARAAGEEAIERWKGTIADFRSSHQGRTAATEWSESLIPPAVRKDYMKGFAAGQRQSYDALGRADQRGVSQWWKLGFFDGAEFVPGDPMFKQLREYWENTGGPDWGNTAAKTAARAAAPLLDPEEAIAKGLNLASLDYPELAEILYERPDWVEVEDAANTLRLSSKTADIIPPTIVEPNRDPWFSGAVSIGDELVTRRQISDLLFGDWLVERGLARRSPSGPYVEDDIDLDALWREFGSRTAKQADIYESNDPIGESIRDKNQPWWWRKIVGPSLDRVNKGLPPGQRVTDINAIPAIQWCRFRRDGYCYFPDELDERGTAEAGYAVWVPKNQGICPRRTHDAQRDCPVSEPGPDSGERTVYPDATIPWHEGGQRQNRSYAVKVELTRKQAGWSPTSISANTYPGLAETLTGYVYDDDGGVGEVLLVPMRGEWVWIAQGRDGSRSEGAERDRQVAQRKVEEFVQAHSELPGQLSLFARRYSGTPIACDKCGASASVSQSGGKGGHTMLCEDCRKDREKLTSTKQAASQERTIELGGTQFKMRYTGNPEKGAGKIWVEVEGSERQQSRMADAVLSWTSMIYDKGKFSRTPDPYILMVSVAEQWRRRGLATAMLSFAREFQPTLKHSDSLTDDGLAFSQNVAKLAMPEGTLVGDGSGYKMGKDTWYEPEPGMWVIGTDSGIGFAYERAAMLPEAQTRFDAMFPGAKCAWQRNLSTWLLDSTKTKLSGTAATIEKAKEKAATAGQKAFDEANAKNLEYLRRTVDPNWGTPQYTGAKDERFAEVGLKQDDDGWYVTTHRARSKSYPTPEDIPQGDVDFIASTGAKTAQTDDARAKIREIDRNLDAQYNDDPDLHSSVIDSCQENAHDMGLREDKDPDAFWEEVYNQLLGILDEYGYNSDGTKRTAKIAKWADIVSKAKQIRSSGGVRVIAKTDNTITAEVKGHTAIYLTTLTREPGTKRVGLWECSCPWNTYAWDRSEPWKSLEGRMCAHALALRFEAASQEMFGGEITEQAETPAWRTSDPTFYTPPDRAALLTMGRAITDQLDALAQSRTAGLTAEAGRRLNDVKVKVRNQIVRLIELLGGGMAEVESYGTIPVRDITYPTTGDLSRGLSYSGARTAVADEDVAAAIDMLQGGFSNVDDPDDEYDPIQELDEELTTEASLHAAAMDAADVAGNPVAVSDGDLVTVDAAAVSSEEAAATYAEMCEGNDFTHAGLIIKALDSGRVLMTQRTPYHGDDEDTYGSWEFPGGGLRDGEDPLSGALREFGEETGLALPDGWQMNDCYQGANPNYAAIVICVPNEAWTTNADMLPQETMGIGWFEPEQLQDSTLARPEIAETEWEIVAEASSALAERAANARRVTARQAVDQHSSIMYDEPQPALPVSLGSEEDDAALLEPSLDDGSLEEDPIVPGDPRLAWVMGDHTAATQDDAGDVAAAAEQFLAKEALKVYTPAEKAAIIDEGGTIGASNLNDLDLSGTHYQFDPDENSLWD